MKRSTQNDASMKDGHRPTSVFLGVEVISIYEGAIHLLGKQSSNSSGIQMRLLCHFCCVQGVGFYLFFLLQILKRVQKD
jgi:hypothetical protein